MDVDTAQRNWELENEIVTIDPEADKIYQHNADQIKAELARQPWKTDPHYYKYIRISAIALIKMVMHARSGGNNEVMGLMQGKVQGDTMYVFDAFALPVEGTETRVNAQDEAYEYMVEYVDKAKAAGRREHVLGWYHSHPGYGCWLSGIDVDTQRMNQRYQEPFVAVVIDPNRTISAGKVDIGAFRCYPTNYKPPANESVGYQTIPLHKIEDYGVHAKEYYPLQVSHFKSTLDTQLLALLWSKHWANTLSQSPLLMNRDFMTKQIVDLANKLDQKSEESYKINQITKDSCNITGEAVRGLITQVLKEQLFNRP